MKLFHVGSYHDQLKLSFIVLILEKMLKNAKLHCVSLFGQMLMLRCFKNHNPSYTVPFKNVHHSHQAHIYASCYIQVPDM